MSPNNSYAHRYSGIDLLSTAVLMVDPNGVAQYANSAAQELLLHAVRGQASMPVWEWLEEAADTMSQAIAAACAQRSQSTRFEASLKRFDDDPLRVLVMVSPMNDSSSGILIEWFPVEMQTQQEREEKLVGQAMSNKELIRGLAHEIKNPLGGIRGAAQLLQMELSTPDLREYTQVIIQEADRLQQLVDRLLAPHRRAAVVTDVNIHEVCERVRSLILVEYPKGLRLVRDYDTSIPEFRGDREQLIQAVLNVAQNAAQAMQHRIANDEAVLTLRTRVARQLTLGKVRHKLALELHVIDNGPGIPEDIRDRVFSPLVTRRDGGTGLGLTLAQTYVQQHQGLIEFETEAGHTDFKILIPLG
jgi:two-component system nitrogen regulation sensor histidine kinase GlnL